MDFSGVYNFMVTYTNIGIIVLFVYLIINILSFKKTKEVNNLFCIMIIILWFVSTFSVLLKSNSQFKYIDFCDSYSCWPLIFILCLIVSKASRK